MTKHRLIIGLLATAALTVGCASAESNPGVTPVASGKLVLKGSMPKLRVVLTQDGAERWELLDVPAATATALQNQHVTVEGMPERAAREGLLAPTLRVTRITPAGK